MLDIDGRRVFDPNAPENADIPLIEVSGDGWTPVRGTPSIEVDLADVRRRGLVGVVTNNLGHTAYVAPGEEFIDPRALTMLCEYQSLFGHARTLDDVLEALDEIRKLIVNAKANGWELNDEATADIWVASTS